MPTVVPEYEYPARRVSWLRRDAILFANTIGCKADEPHFLYELHPEFQVFPTYPIVLTFKYDKIDTVDFLAENSKAGLPPGCPPLDWTLAVDGRRRIAVYRHIPPSSEGANWEIRSKIVGVYDKGPGKGSVLEKEHVLVNADTEAVYTRAWESAFFVGTGGWGGERGPRMRLFPPPESARSPDSVASIQTTRETAHLYRLNGDYNPLHATPDVGQSLGYGGIILHGLFSWNVAAQRILREYGDSQGTNLRDFEARFVAPVKLGDELKIRMWDLGEFKDSIGEIQKSNEKLREVRFEVKVGEKLVLANGRALLVVGSQAKSML